MTAADELRTAAERLRALAVAASVDRHGCDTSTWAAGLTSSRSAQLYGPGQERLIRGGSTGAHGRGLRPHLAPAHAAYIAAMDPTVGAALADWLESAAEDAEQIGADPHALAVARAINGGAP